MKRNGTDISRTRLWSYAAVLLLVGAVLSLTPTATARAQSVDLAVSGYGLSLGNSTRFTGIRINAVDRDVEAINGLNVTLWNPAKNPNGDYNGITVGLIGTKARRINGIALSGIGVSASEHMRGVAAGTLGVGAGNLTGVAVGLIMVDVKERFRGINLAGFWTGSTKQFDGLSLSLGSAMARNLTGGSVGGFAAGGEKSMTGLAIAIGGVYAADFRGVGVAGFGGGGEEIRGVFAAGFGVGTKHLDGIALTLGGIGSETIDGIALAGLGLGAKERFRGIALGGVLAFAPVVTGVMVGALNGVYIDRIDLEDFLHFRLANQRFTGLSVGIVNYTAHLHGVQLGLFNYARNNPRWLRLLPLVNVHL